jgi:mannose-1-phosphate guanylyltransferase
MTETELPSKCIIMAGGKGTRLWPISRKSKPKQFQALTSDKTMLQETFLRLRKKYSLSDVYISTNDEYVSEVEREILELPKKNIIAEPEPRGTASSIALASALIARESGMDTLLAVFPSDHFIKHEDIFLKALHKAEEFLGNHPQHIVTFGILPNYAETGYGYIKKGQLLVDDGEQPLFAVNRFVEKPDALTAEKYIKDGGYFWNSGMYVFRVGDLLEKLKKYTPDTYKRAMKIYEASQESFAEVMTQEYPLMDKINIEYSVIENDPQVVVMPLDLGWSDVGSWSALKDTLTETTKGHFSKGEHIDFDSENLLVHGSKKLIVTVGVKDLVIIDTDDAILVCDKKDAHRISNVVKALEASNHKSV